MLNDLKTCILSSIRIIPPLGTLVIVMNMEYLDLSIKTELNSFILLFNIYILEHHGSPAVCHRQVVALSFHLLLSKYAILCILWVDNHVDSIDTKLGFREVLEHDGDAVFHFM